MLARTAGGEWTVEMIPRLHWWKGVEGTSQMPGRRALHKVARTGDWGVLAHTAGCEGTALTAANALLELHQGKGSVAWPGEGMAMSTMDRGFIEG